jgi:excisionase family DNA binding protein
MDVTIEQRLMSVGEAAEFLCLSPRTIYGFVCQRRIPFRKAGRRVLFLRSELLEWTKPVATQSRMELMRR